MHESVNRNVGLQLSALPEQQLQRNICIPNVHNYAGIEVEHFGGYVEPLTTIETLFEDDRRAIFLVFDQLNECAGDVLRIGGIAQVIENHHRS